MRKLVIIGASGFGREVAWVIERANGRSPSLEVVGFCDDAADKQSGVIGGFPLLGSVEAAATSGAEFFFCAIGDNWARQAVAARAVACGLKPVAVVDPSAAVAPDAVVGDGSFVGVGSVVSTGARVGAGVIVNHGACVGHDAELGDFAQLCPGAKVSGGCRMGEGALLGSNACAVPNVRVGAWGTIGAGAVAMRDLPEGGSLLRIGVR